MTIEVRDGVTVIEGEPEALVTADYPYYRDDPEVWADRLRAIRDELGIDLITCYLPWRHHQPTPDGPPDFAGHTHPSRDVVGFLALCHELGLKVIAKPGPFIHAETNYGGLPDWVCPRTNPAIEPLLDAKGEASAWLGEPLPAPLGAAFDPLVTQWLAATGKEVLEPATWPEGPVIMMQIANEGIFTSGALPLSAYDYSASGLAFFRDRLQAWYGTLEEYNRLHGTAIRDWSEAEPPRSWTAPARSEEQQAYCDWGRFHAEYLAEVYHRWAAAVNCRVPVVVNLNPPAEHHHSFDDWLARVRPELWEGIHYGFTNWMGVVSANPDSQARYVTAAKRAPGPNLEENWGFSELYDPAYADATTSFHQSLLALAAGGTGFNVYTGVGTSGWLEGLDSVHDSPYPDCAPIGADGSVTPKAHAVRSLADFFARHGAEFLECVPEAGETYGLYLPYAGIAAWAEPGSGAPELGRSLRAFHDRCRAAGRDYRLLELESATAVELAAHPRLTVPGGAFMHRQVQRLLAGHVEAGCLVEVDGPLPTLDEFLRPCRILAEALAGVDRADFAAPASRVKVVDGHADAYLRTHPDQDISYLTVLTQSDHEGAVLVELDGRPIELITARGGAAVVRLVAGELDDFLVKGVNGYLDSAVPAGVKVGGEILIADHPADLDRIGGEFRVFPAA
ncbi:beta-galactosidase [Acrocarpospora catenulata]|uniref:beta-galactosidase n=1 Tax=Acrocarpospora catenulata TaxID=2836182 RepID=UPI001BDA56DF|nr:beta-galactosidase [Acrocarpospora catenulata]